MIFGSLTKLTLLDYPHKVACAIFTVGCNFRCPFCHNAGLVLTNSAANSTPKGVEIISEEEVLNFLTKRRGMLEGVCLSGGEPLLQPDVAEFLRKMKALGYAVKLDTNGSFPQKLQALCADGLVDYVAMDVKNSPALYAATVGAPVNLADIDSSVQFLKKNTVDYEFRTTVTGKHTAQAMEELGVWLEGAKRLFLQKYRAEGDLVGDALGLDLSDFACDDATMRNYRNILRRYVPQTHLRGMDDD